MWDHLRTPRPAEAIAGVHIGGGATLFLLEQLIDSGFDTYLRAVMAGGAPIYGGSAGAIVLGESLAASRDAMEAGHGATPGLGLVPGHAIACHYDADHDARLAGLSRERRTTIIAISESTGAAYFQGQLRSVGDEPVVLFHPDGSRLTV
jgi:dipeptidase E